MNIFDKIKLKTKLYRGIISTSTYGIMLYYWSYLFSPPCGAIMVLITLKTYMFFINAKAFVERKSSNRRGFKSRQKQLFSMDFQAILP